MSSKTKAELIAHAENLGLKVGPRMTNEELERQIAKAERAAEKGQPFSNATPMPEPASPDVEIEPVQVVTPDDPPETKPSKRLWRAISYLTVSSIGDKQIAPGEIIELPEAEAQHFLTVGGAIEPA